MVTLVVDEYDTAIAYYRDALGFELVEDTRLSDVKRWVVMRPDSGGAHVLLAQAASDEQRAAIGRQTGGRVGFFLHTADFDADVQRMTDAGVDFTEQVRHEDYGRVVVIRDLYGNKWDIVERSGL
jgi:catechol 2,3-dioxygenase-like lactoylglutathione lyase family enzyme